MFCRLCLHNIHDHIGFPLFDSNGETSLVKIIAKFLMLELTQYDDVSTIICNDCWQHLDDFDKFCKYVEEKQTTLCNEFLEIKSTTPCNANILAPADDTTGVSIENNDESLLDIKDVLVGENSYEPESATVEKEEFSFADNAPVNGDNACDNNIPLEKLIRKIETAKLRKANTKTKKIQAAKNGTTTKNVKGSIKNGNRTYIKRNHSQPATDLGSTNIIKLENGTESYENTEATETKSKRSMEEKRINDDFIAAHMQLKCDICELPLYTFRAVREHFRNKHDSKGYVTCCGRRFAERMLLVDHINVHLNPLHFQCSNCGKSFNSKYSLDSHITHKHPNSEKLKYHCTICDTKFVRKSRFELHNLNHKTEKKDTCNICQKSFASKYRLKMHMERLHGEPTFSICNFCGQQFRYKAALERHVAEHEGNYEMPMQCSICHDWFKNKYALRRHNEVHNPTKSECQICFRTYKSKRSLQSHVRYAHSTKCNLICTFCSKTFKKPSNLQEHVATHTGEKHNKCTHCTKEFRSKANMYVHIKRDHNVEWMQTKKARIKKLETYAQKKLQEPVH